MSEQLNDGGPAFPTPAGHARIDVKHPQGDYQRTVEVCTHGMSLRDWFAGQRAAGINNDVSVALAPDVAARNCYAFADAMLKERTRV